MIRWTTREWRLIADWLVKNGVVASERGWRPAVLDAMKGVLPTNRWRAADCLNNSKTILVPLMEEARAALNKVPTASEVIERFNKQQTVATLKDFSIDQMISEIVARIAASVAAEIELQVKAALVQQTFVPSRKHDPHPEPSAPDNRPVVLVIGPRAGQQRELEQAHRSFLDLRFVASDDPPMSINAYRHANHAVLWTNYCSHAHQDHAQKVLGKFHYVTGGMTALHNELRKIT